MIIENQKDLRGKEEKKMLSKMQTAKEIHINSYELFYSLALDALSAAIHHPERKDK